VIVQSELIKKIDFTSLPKAEFLSFSEPLNVARLLDQLEVLLAIGSFPNFLHDDVPKRDVSHEDFQ
jgi:hypothetical protein